MSTPKTAQIIEWYEDRGFGFLAGEDDGEKIFLHIRELKHSRTPPSSGDSISFVMGTDPKGRPQAVQATNLSKLSSKVCWKCWIGLALLMILPIAAFSKIAIFVQAYWLLAFVAVASAVTYGFYSRDKKLAVTHGFRISELRLHVLELIGGWPGAFIAQRRFHHKSAKGAYKFIFWVIVLGHQLVAIDILRGGEISNMTWSFIRPILGFD